MDSSIINAIIGASAGTLTAYVTTFIQLRQERRKWRREFTLRYAEAQAQGSVHRDALATQHAIAYMRIVIGERESEKVFIPPFCRITIGRSKDCTIRLTDPHVSRQAAILRAEEREVFLTDMASRMAVRLTRGDSNVPIKGETKLLSDDVLKIGETSLTFVTLT